MIEDRDVTQVFDDISKRVKNLTKKQLGSQYDWLARFSKDIVNLELSIEKGTRPVRAIMEYGGIKKIIDNKIGEYYKLDKSVSDDITIKIFGNYHYPLLDYTKLQMKKEAEEYGFIDLMNKTWFCHNPIDNQPCGVCNPCIGTIEGGLEYRFNQRALSNYKKAKFYQPIKKTVFLMYQPIKKILILIGIRKIYRKMRNK